jgi:hypothetical protein
MILIPKTLKGRNRIHEAGTDRVLVIREEFDLPIGSGRWFLVRFKDADHKHDRWVREIDDPDFAIEYGNPLLRTDA